jgi:hypothetical protein
MMSLGRISSRVVGVVAEDADASARPHRLVSPPFVGGLAFILLFAR